MSIKNDQGLSEPLPGYIQSAGVIVQREAEIFWSTALIVASIVLFITFTRAGLFLACCLGLAVVVATVLFIDKLTYVFVFSFALMPHFVGVATPSGLPDITSTRALILYYTCFSLLFNRSTIFANIKKLRMDMINAALIIFVVTNGLVFLAHRTGVAANALLVLMFEDIFVFYLVFLNIRNYKEARGCFTALLLCAGLLCLFAIFEFFTGINIFSRYGTLGNVSLFDSSRSLMRLGSIRVYTAFGHPIAMGCYTLLIFPIAFNLFLNENNSFRKYFYFSLSGLLVIMLLFALSRMPILCFIGSFALLFIVIKREQKTKFIKVMCIALALGIICLAGGLIPEFVINTLSSLAATLTGGSVDDFGGNAGASRGRLNLIPITLEALEGKMLLGAGLNYLQTVKIYYFDYHKNPYMPYLINTFDNDHLKRFLYGGFIGAGGYIVLYGVFMLHALRTARDKRVGEELNVIAQSVFVAMCAYLISLAAVDHLGTIPIYFTITAVFAAAVRESAHGSVEMAGPLSSAHND